MAFSVSWNLVQFKQQANFHDLRQLMRLWYLLPRRPAKAQACLRIHAVSPEPSLFAHIKYGSRRRVQPEIRYLAPLDVCTYAFENEFTEDKKCQNLTSWLICTQQLPLNFFPDSDTTGSLNETGTHKVGNIKFSKIFLLQILFHHKI